MTGSRCWDRPFQLGRFIVEPDTRRIRVGKKVHRVEPKAMQVLLALAERPGAVASRAELIERVWEGDAVTDAVLTVAVHSLREALEDDARAPQIIETIPKKGYRLLQTPSEASKFRPYSRRWAWGTVVILALALAGIWVQLRDSDPGPAEMPAIESSVAVLPFRIVGTEADGGGLTERLTDVTINRLSQDPHLRVVSRREVERVATPDRSLREIGRLCGVQSVVEATLIVNGDLLEANVELIDLGADRHIWGRSYTVDRSDLDEFQEQMAEDLRVTLRDSPPLPPSRQ